MTRTLGLLPRSITSKARRQERLACQEENKIADKGEGICIKRMQMVRIWEVHNSGFDLRDGVGKIFLAVLTY